MIYSIASGVYNQESHPALRAGNNTITKEHHFGCVSQAYFDKLVTYIAEKDLQALNAAFIPALLNGTCTKFQKGEPVHLVEAGLFSGTIKVRRPGETVEYLTIKEVVW